MLFRKGRSLLIAALVFVCMCMPIFKAREFKSAAQRERTTTARDISVHHHIFRGLRFNYYSCTYNFDVEGSFYLGLGDCPQGIADDTVKGKYSAFARAATGAGAAVYYDPSDPSVNSLLEFSAASENEYRIAAPWICLGAVIILFFVFGRLLNANEKRSNGVAVDARGTVIYPEEIDLGSDFAGLTNRSAMNSAPSPELRELYLAVVNKIHPDRAANEADLALRERLMKEANAAFERGDAERLRRVLEQYDGAITAP